MTPTLPSSADAYSALQGFDSTRPTATDYISKANSQYNVPQDQQQVSGLQGSINNLTQSLQGVAPSVQGRTSGTFTTAGQQSALINKEQAPIATDISNENSSLGTAQTNQAHDEDLANQMVQALLGQDNTKYQGLLDTYNAASGSEKEQEAEKEFQASQALEQQKLAETTREFNLTPRAASASDYTQQLLDFMKGQQGGNSSSQLNNGEQQAVNEVNDRIKGAGANTDALLSDYAATKISADNGDAGDKAKLQAYALAKPSLFGAGGSALSKVNALISTWGTGSAGGGGGGGAWKDYSSQLQNPSLGLQ